MPLCVDVSNYTGPIDATEASALVAAGVRRVVVGMQYPDAPYPPGVAHEQIPALLDVGIEVEAYVYLWLALDAAQQVRDALDRLARWRSTSGTRIGRLWLDVEDTSARGMTPAQRVEAVRAAVAACGDLPVGIYSAAWWWTPNVADATDFAALPLWVAQYDGTQDVAFTPFGGWTRAAMKQYAGTSTFAGLTNVDVNWYEAELAPLTEQEFDWVFAALYRGMPAAGIPMHVRWGTRCLDASGEELHTLVVSGRQ